MKSTIESLESIGLVDITRSNINVVGGASWSISFLDDATRIHQGNMPEFLTHSSLTGGSGKVPSIVVQETRKGTVKEVQSVVISAGGSSVNALSKFKLSFIGEETNDILALPAGGTTCLGSKYSKQIITSKTENTSGEGGDDTVSPLTTFVLLYGDYNSSPISANNGTCVDTASVISTVLMNLSPLNNITVSGKDSGLNDKGCVWIVSLLGVVGNPELLQGMRLFEKFQC